MRLYKFASTRTKRTWIGLVAEAHWSVGGVTTECAASASANDSSNKGRVIANRGGTVVELHTITDGVRGNCGTRSSVGDDFTSLEEVGVEQIGQAEFVNDLSAAEANALQLDFSGTLFSEEIVSDVQTKTSSVRKCCVQQKKHGR